MALCIEIPWCDYLPSAHSHNAKNYYGLVQLGHVVLDRQYASVFFLLVSRAFNQSCEAVSIITFISFRVWWSAFMWHRPCQLMPFLQDNTFFFAIK